MAEDWLPLVTGLIYLNFAAAIYFLTQKENRHAVMSLGAAAILLFFKHAY